MKKLLLALLPTFFLWSLPVYAVETFPAPLCITQKGVTSDGVYILFFDNGGRVIVTKEVFDLLNVGDCIWL